MPTADINNYAIPMMKGAKFLCYLEEIVGGSYKMVQFLKHYLEKYTFKSVTTGEFRSTFISFFKEVKDLDKIDWNTWLYKPGDAPNKVSYKNLVLKTLREQIEWSELNKISI